MTPRPKDTVWRDPFGVHVGWVPVSPWEPNCAGRDLHPSFFTHPWASSSHQWIETPLLCLGNSAFLRNEMAKPPSGPGGMVLFTCRAGNRPWSTHHLAISLFFLAFLFLTQ